MKAELLLGDWISAKIQFVALWLVKPLGVCARDPNVGFGRYPQDLMALEPIQFPLQPPVVVVRLIGGLAETVRPLREPLDFRVRKV